MATTSPGIDYSCGMSNFDPETGIHFGVIPANEVCQAWYDSAEPNYGEPSCPQCGDPLPEGFGDSGMCHCGYEIQWAGDECYSDTPLSWDLDDGEYCASQGGDDCDIFVLKSSFYTRAQFCSPCAPGAGYLLGPCDDGPKTYCFGHDWFEGGKAPYPVYRVSDDSLVSSTD